MIKTGFNDNWTYKRSLTGKNMQNVAARDAISITLPHDAMIREERNQNQPSGTSGAYYPGNVYTYSKVFFVPESYREKKLILEFDGVYQNARIFVNEQFAGAHKYGYTAFFIDMTPFVKYGMDNQIDVTVNNMLQPSSRWYTGSGIFRPVTLHIGGELYVTENGLKVSSPQVEAEIALIDVAICLGYSGRITKTILIKTELTDLDGKAEAQMETVMSLFPQENGKVHQKIYVRMPRLWSTETPELYRCRVTVVEGRKIWDTAETVFGIRRFTLDPVQGFRLNGKGMKLRGACLHHDNGVLGAAAFSRAEERRIRLLKEAGFNAVRSAHNPASAAFLDACDRLGMLVMEDAFDMWNIAKRPFDYSSDFCEHWEEDLEAMVEKDYNHPSVFMYSIGNEIQEACNTPGTIWNRRLADKIRELDPDRLVSNAINGLFALGSNMYGTAVEMGFIQTDGKTSGRGDVNDLMTALFGKMNDLAAHPFIRSNIEEACGGLDAVGYNYMRGTYRKDVEEFPNRMIYGSETLPPDIDLNWKIVKENSQVFGDFTWTGWDYIGEAGIGVVNYNGITGFNSPWPCYLAGCGDFDITGFRKPISYFREIVFGLRKKPYIAVQRPEHYKDKKNLTPWIMEESIHSWTFKGFEGKPCIIEIYADADEVELLRNGCSLGRKPAGEKHRFRALFDTIYEAGRIEAIAYENGVETGRDFLDTAGESITFQIRMDKTEMSADGQDLVFLEIMLVDEHENVNPCMDRCVTVEVNGAGVLSGIGNADPYSLENFEGPDHQTFDGRLLAVVRAVREGEISIRVKAKGVPEKAVFLKAEQNGQTNEN